jgi:geranylgeranyl transferase type-2 subunit beta
MYPGSSIVSARALVDRHRSTDVDPFCLVILSLQQPSGVFAGDGFGETDTRFLYCGVAALSLLGYLDRLDAEQTVSYIRQCKNFDGGYGSVIGAESHAAQGGRTVVFPLESRS